MKKSIRMRSTCYFLFLGFMFFCCSSPSHQKAELFFSDGEVVKISKADLQDKNRGGWAGQLIGCTYGGPTEFKWQGTMIHDEVPIPWDESVFEFWYDRFPGLYDDLYMDITFVSVFEEHGLDAPALLHAKAFAHAGYPLWHANQAARYNILNGIMPPLSGHYHNNPHADDIDFQIEADFAGLMSPGMINASSEICDRVGHIMTYGDGWYGGVFVAGMYSQAYVSDDIEFVVGEALKTIPRESRFHKMIADVIQWHTMYPDDWKRTWFEIQRKWSHEKGCPDGVFDPFNIEASLNAAYIVLGLLYGQGDFGKTIDICTRAGQDSDCNPSNAGGILGTILGYENIPDYWKRGLHRVANRNFDYVDMSLQDVCEASYDHALQMITAHGGRITDDSVEIVYQRVIPVKLEQSFENLFPKEKISHRWPFEEQNIDQEHGEYRIEFEGNGIVISGNAVKRRYDLPDYDLQLHVFVDGKLIEQISLPTQSLIRKTDIYWNYRLSEGSHAIKIEAADVPPGYSVTVSSALIYSEREK